MTHGMILSFLTLPHFRCYYPVELLPTNAQPKLVSPLDSRYMVEGEVVPVFHKVPRHEDVSHA